MNKNTFRTTLLAAAAISMAVPVTAFASPNMGMTPEPVVQKQDEWKKIGIASGAAALLGILTKNGTVTTLGAAGALYSAWRYEEDRKSSNKQRRARAALYSKRSIVVDGHRYKRKTVKKGGKTYYQFVRA